MAENPMTKQLPAADPAVQHWRPSPDPAPVTQAKVREIGGRKDGTDPTRYGDWEKHGRCIDF